MTKGKDMVFLGMSTWHEWASQGLVNRSYHVLTQLRKSGAVGKVLYVDFPPTALRSAARRRFQDSRIAGEVKAKDFFSQVVEVEKDVFVLTVYFFFLQQKIMCIVDKAMNVLAMRPDLLWSYNPLLPIFFEEGRYGTKIFDAVDDWTAHGSHVSHRKIIQRCYQEIGKNADTIFAVSENLAAKFPPKKTHVVPNGVDGDHFSAATKEPEDFSVIPHPRVGYAGVIQERMDFALLEKAVAAYPRYSFVFVGWVWDEVRKERDALARHKNVYFLGKKSYNELPAYMQHMDIAIIPHKNSSLTKSMDPMKLYEYLACGKPVVVTDVPLSLQAPFIYRAKNQDDFMSMIAAALTTAPAYACDAKGLAAKQEWKDRVATMLSIIAV